MIISDTSRMIGVFTIALLTAEFGQIWAKLGLRKSHMTLGEIVQLHNCAVTDKGSIDECYRDLDKARITKITRLHNCAVADIMPHCGMTSHHSKG